jgi:hypothetical protein
VSKISLAPDASGTGIFTIASPNSNTNRTLTLPDDTGTIVTNSGNQAGSFTTLNTSGAVVFNDAGADVDFRVEGDTNANLIVADAGADKVGIGTNTFNTNGGVLQVSNGISFPATQSALSDANTLDDYEEGTWTPVADTAGYTMTASSGQYTKIGRAVFLRFSVRYNNISGQNSLNVISGVPFTSAGQQFVGSGRECTTTGAIYVAYLASSSAVIELNSSSGISNGSARTFVIDETYVFSLNYYV